MKPYLVHKTWIDLDTIQMINAESFCSGYPPYNEHYPVVSVWRMFCEDPMLVHLDDASPETVSEHVVIAKAKPVLAAFISAWKAKDEPKPCVASNADY